MKWYEQKFVNHRDWILDHLTQLGLKPNELTVVLLIDFMNEHHEKITVDDIAKKSNMSVNEVNSVVSVLCAKKYLDIKASSKYVRFLLNGLFEADIAQEQSAVDSPLFDLFETEFGRPLSEREMSKISEWNRTTDRKLIIYALREASAYQKLRLSYIDSILKDWKEKGYTVQMIEEGRS